MDNINNKILFAIIYDLYEGLGVDPENGYVDNDSKYYDWLLSKFDCAMYADVIMSVQDKAYYELIEGLSIIVGSGSHFGSNGFWTVAIPICKNKSIDPAIRLNEIVEEYEIEVDIAAYSVDEVVTSDREGVTVTAGDAEGLGGVPFPEGEAVPEDFTKHIASNWMWNMYELLDKYYTVDEVISMYCFQGKRKYSQDLTPDTKYIVVAYAVADCDGMPQLVSEPTVTHFTTGK